MNPSENTILSFCGAHPGNFENQETWRLLPQQWPVSYSGSTKAGLQMSWVSVSDLLTESEE